LSEIRVTYSGLIAFVIGLSTVITGMVFLLIVTRTFSQEELGTWGFIGGLITYALIIEPLISYWVPRNIARGIKSGRTAIISSGLFSVLGAVVYLIIAFVIGHQTNADVKVLFFAVLMIPLMFLNRTLDAINLGWKPHVNSYGLLAFDLSKIPTALIFIYFLEMGVQGAILSLSVSYLVSIGILAFYSRNLLRGLFKKEYLKKWLKISWIPAYRKFGGLITFDVMVFSVLTGSVIGLSYWTVAITLSTLVRHTNQLTRAVYPKLLSGGKKEYVQQNLVRLLYFSLPFTAISITFARPLLFALNPVYEVAVPIVILLSIRVFIINLSHTFHSALKGIETVDMDENSTYKDYLKSALFRVPTIRLMEKALYIGALMIGLYIFIQKTDSQFELVYYWAIIALVTQIPFTFYFYYITRQKIPLSVHWLTIMKYLISSVLIFGGIYFLMDNFLEYDKEIFVFLPKLLIFIAIGIGGYVGITYLIDKKTRIFFKAIFSEVLTKKSNKI